MSIQNISFTGSRFLRRQETTTCALCGEPVFPEKKLTSKLNHAFHTQRGKELTKTLDLYFKQFREGRIPESLLKIYELSKDPKYEMCTFKNLTYHVSDPKIDYDNMRNTIRNLFSDIILSLDHIIPRAAGGINNQANYLPMHVGCNNARKIYTYEYWDKLNPQFINHIRGSIASIKKAKELKKVRLIPNYFEKLLTNLENQGLERERFLDLEF